MRRLGFTLTELLVIVVLSLFVVATVTSFFLYFQKRAIGSLVRARAGVSVFQAVEVINSDLIKAGYGISDDLAYKPVEWDAANKTLIIRYVDYQKSGCEGRKFAVGDSCSYIVKYRLFDNNLERLVDEKADGKDTGFVGMFDVRRIKVKDFLVHINGNVVDYSIVVYLEGKPFRIGSKVICRNWQLSY